MTDDLWHPQQRALERYGLALVRQDLEEIAQLAEPRNCFLRHRDGMAVHIVRWRGHALVICVKPHGGRQVVTTFLPPDYFGRGRRKAYHAGKRRKPAHASAEMIAKVTR